MSTARTKQRSVQQPSSERQSVQRWPCLLLACLLLPITATSSLTAQIPASPQDPLQKEWRKLQDTFQKPRQKSKNKSPQLRRRDWRIKQLQLFVAEHEKAEPSSPSLQKARSELALLCLRSLRTEEADQLFGAILDSAGPRQLDIHSSAIYGLAQVRELEGKTRSAKKLLLRLIREGSGTRYTDLARAALKRLEQPSQVKPGTLVPDFRSHVDLQHHPHRRGELLGSPSLLIFWSADQPETLRRVLAAAKLSRSQVIAFAIGSDADTLERRLKAEAETPAAIIIHLDKAFLDDIVLDYGVRRLPSTFLLDSQSKLVGRNLAAHQLTRAVSALQTGKK